MICHASFIDRSFISYKYVDCNHLKISNILYDFVYYILGLTGVWTTMPDGQDSKIAAIGIKLR